MFLVNSGECSEKGVLRPEEDKQDHFVAESFSKKLSRAGFAMESLQQALEELDCQDKMESMDVGDFPASQSVARLLAEKVDVLRADDCFMQFLAECNLPIPFEREIATENPFSQINAWLSSLKEPLHSYLLAQSAKAHGVSPKELVEGVLKGGRVPGFVDRRVFESALKACMAFRVFTREILEMEKAAAPQPGIYSLTTRTHGLVGESSCSSAFGEAKSVQQEPQLQANKGGTVRGVESFTDTMELLSLAPQQKEDEISSEQPAKKRDLHFSSETSETVLLSDRSAVGSDCYIVETSLKRSFM